MRAAKSTSYLIGLLLLATIVAPAYADDSSLVGTWRVVAEFDGSDRQDRILETYNDEGTWLATGPTNLAGTGHGVWEETGDGEFSTANTIFGFDTNGDLIAVVNGRSEIAVSSDGATYTGVFRAEIVALDGTVLLVNTGTVTGERVTLGGDDDDDSDSDD